MANTLTFPAGSCFRLNLPSLSEASSHGLSFLSSSRLLSEHQVAISMLSFLKRSWLFVLIKKDENTLSKEGFRDHASESIGYPTN